jgi:hypothetical protein
MTVIGTILLVCLIVGLNLLRGEEVEWRETWSGSASGVVVERDWTKDRGENEQVVLVSYPFEIILTFEPYVRRYRRFLSAIDTDEKLDRARLALFQHHLISLLSASSTSTRVFSFGFRR